MTECKEGNTGSDLANYMNLEDGPVVNGYYIGFYVSHSLSLSLSLL